MKDYVYFTYIATNFPRCTVLYTGITSDPYGREWEHQNKEFPDSFSARYNINRIVYFEYYDDVNVAIKREKAIKGSSRKKKMKLIESINPDWSDLVEKMRNEENVVGNTRD